MSNIVDPLARGGVRRYLDTVEPIEYEPDCGEVNLSELSLTGLFDLYGSDKGSIKHGYSEQYSKLIEELCDGKRRDFELHLAEFGVACGSSLKAWSKYLPRSKVYGFDIRAQCAYLCQEIPNVEIIVTDIASDSDRLRNRFNDYFDVIIDDASHISEDIVRTFHKTWPWLRSGGVYAIEDMACTYSAVYTSSYNETFNRNAQNERGVFLELLDLLLRQVDQKKEISRLSYTPQLLLIEKI